MSNPIEPPQADSSPRREILSGDRDALAAIDTVVASARQCLVIFDHVLKERGYNSPARTEALRKFLLADRGTEIRIALHETRGLEADCPRLVALIQQYPSSIHIHKTHGVARSANDPFVIADNNAFWHKLHYEHPRSVLALGDVPDTQALIDRFNEIWESSEPAQVGGATGL